MRKPRRCFYLVTPIPEDQSLGLVSCSGWGTFEPSFGIFSARTSVPQLLMFVWYCPEEGWGREEFLTMSPKIDCISSTAYLEKAVFWCNVNCMENKVRCRPLDREMDGHVILECSLACFRHFSLFPQKYVFIDYLFTITTFHTS